MRSPLISLVGTLYNFGVALLSAFKRTEGYDVMRLINISLDDAASTAERGLGLIPRVTGRKLSKAFSVGRPSVQITVRTRLRRHVSTGAIRMSSDEIAEAIECTRALGRVENWIGFVKGNKKQTACWQHCFIGL